MVFDTFWRLLAEFIETTLQNYIGITAARTSSTQSSSLYRSNKQASDGQGTYVDNFNKKQLLMVVLGFNKICGKLIAKF